MPDRFLSDRARRVKQRLIFTAKGKRGARTMTREEAKEALSFLFSCESNDIQKTAFLISMRFKGTEAEELMGFCDAIKEESISINPSVENILDCSGPYDGRKETLNVSVASSITAAAGGVSIILHSDTNMPPKKGITTAEILEALGIPAFLEPEDVQKQVEKTGVGFIHAQKFAFSVSLFRHIRETLGNRSFLQNCEILNNPANAKNKLIGAAHSHFLEKLTKTAAGLGINRAIAVEGIEGSDELPLKKSAIVELKDNEITTKEIDPEEFGLKPAEPYKVKSPSENAEIIYDALSCSTDKYNDSISLNAGIRLYLCNEASSIEDGIKKAVDIIKSKEALKRLEMMRSVGKTG